MSDISIPSLASFTSDVVYNDGANTFTYAGGVEFREDRTPLVQTLSQTTGDVFGGYDITLNGQYLDIGTPHILIDGQECVSGTVTASSITCNVSSRLTLPASNSFTVMLGDNTAIVSQTFRYVMRWSDIRTWGTDMPPIDGDLVHVPPGMNLLVDQTTPKLKGILVENGTLTFADEADMEIHA